MADVALKNGPVFEAKREWRFWLAVKRADEAKRDREGESRIIIWKGEGLWNIEEIWRSYVDHFIDGLLCLTISDSRLILYK
jgi:hypothetical protein